MASRRTLKIAQAVREVVAMSLLTDLKDPRVEHVTITSVTVSGDGRQAKVFFTVFGNDPAKEHKALAGLTSAAGFLQQKCARRIDARYTPKLQFAVDEGAKNLMKVSEILQREKIANAQAVPSDELSPSGEEEGEAEDASGEDSGEDEDSAEDNTSR
ncbi:MAG: 30S ribosome-binding factor RbfA [Thermoguttaceae bacterium]|nr:30S ribosome-binding factor RbfA [Thermoguttaceae bacterium]